MELLSQYKQDHPEAFQEQKRPPLTHEYGRQYTGMIAFVIRLSGGRIRDANAATRVLLIAAAVIILISVILFFRTGTPRPSGPIVPVAGPGTQ